MRRGASEKEQTVPAECAVWRARDVRCWTVRALHAYQERSVHAIIARQRATFAFTQQVPASNAPTAAQYCCSAARLAQREQARQPFRSPRRRGKVALPPSAAGAAEASTGTAAESIVPPTAAASSSVVVGLRHSSSTTLTDMVFGALYQASSTSSTFAATCKCSMTRTCTSRRWLAGASQAFSTAASITSTASCSGFMLAAASASLCLGVNSCESRIGLGNLLLRARLGLARLVRHRAEPGRGREG